jgi:crotonobetainyl-CoA:carnitine CoA-transferase CaiB-like acyl-CoA transferase
LAALRQAGKTGEGCDVDVSLFDVALHQLGYAGTWYLNEGLESSRVARGSHMSVSPVQTFTARDGWIYVMCMTERFWELMLDKLGRNDLKADPRFCDQNRRSQNRDALTEILDAEFAKAPAAFWLETFRGTLPVAPVLSVRDALENPFVAEVGMVGPVPHALRPDMRLLANPIKFNGERLSQAPGAAFGAGTGEPASAAQPLGARD